MGGKRILVGKRGGPTGVRALGKLGCFPADPDAIASYGPLTDEAGTRRIALTVLAEGLGRIEGVADRDAAARLTGTRLYVDRDRLPPAEEEEYSLADLVGLAAATEAGQSLGMVRAVEDHGAGAFLVLDGPPERMLPFTRAVVPVVDIAGGRLVVVLPDEVVVQPQAGDAEDAA